MKKLYLLTIPLLLAGCQATLPENHEDSNSQDGVIPSVTRYHTSIAKPTKIETDNSKTGEYPQQYKYIIANSIQAQPEPLFKPIPYTSSKSIQSWGTCYTQFQDGETKYFLALIKNNKIIENLTSPALKKTCEDLQEQQLRIETINEKRLKENTLSQFSNIVDDPSKFHLFGEPPNNPVEIMKTQLNFFLEDPQSSEWKNVSVRKTFLISNDNVIYCYLVFANLRTKDISTGLFGSSRNAVFYIKNNKILEHKIFSVENSGLKAKPSIDNDVSDFDNSTSLSSQSLKPRIKQSFSQSSPKEIKADKGKTSKGKKSSTATKSKASTKDTKVSTQVSTKTKNTSSAKKETSSSKQKK